MTVLLSPYYSANLLLKCQMCCSSKWTACNNKLYHKITNVHFYIHLMWLHMHTCTHVYLYPGTCTCRSVHVYVCGMCAQYSLKYCYLHFFSSNFSPTTIMHRSLLPTNCTNQLKCTLESNTITCNTFNASYSFLLCIHVHVTLYMCTANLCMFYLLIPTCKTCIIKNSCNFSSNSL